MPFSPCITVTRSVGVVGARCESGASRVFQMLFALLEVESLVELLIASAPYSLIALSSRNVCTLHLDQSYNLSNPNLRR